MVIDMKKIKNKRLKKFIDYLIIVIIGVIMLYPIFWMFFATFKSNEEIYSSIKLLPKSFSLQYYIDGWKGTGKITYTQFFLNTLEE